MVGDELSCDLYSPLLVLLLLLLLLYGIASSNGVKSCTFRRMIETLLTSWSQLQVQDRLFPFITYAHTPLDMRYYQ